MRTNIKDIEQLLNKTEFPTTDYVITKGSGSINKDLWIVHRDGERISGAYLSKLDARITALKEADARDERANLSFRDV